MKIELMYTHNLHVSISECFLTDLREKFFVKRVSWSADTSLHKSNPLHPARHSMNVLGQWELNRLLHKDAIHNTKVIGKSDGKIFSFSKGKRTCKIRHRKHTFMYVI